MNRCGRAQEAEQPLLLKSNWFSLVKQRLHRSRSGTTAQANPALDCSHHSGKCWFCQYRVEVVEYTRTPNMFYVYFITERVSEAKVLTFDSDRATVTQG
jgi:hypothetical protein